MVQEKKKKNCLKGLFLELETQTQDFWGRARAWKIKRVWEDFVFANLIPF